MVKPLKLKFGIQLGKSAIVQLPLRKFKFYVFKIKKYKNNKIAYLYNVIIYNELFYIMSLRLGYGLY